MYHRAAVEVVGVPKEPEDRGWDHLLREQRADLVCKVLMFLIPVLLGFSVLRLITGPLYMSGVGFAVVSVLTKDLVCYKRTNRFWLPPGALILLLALGECVSFKATGVAGIFWVYPTILVAFWTLEHGRAARAIALSSVFWVSSLLLLMPLEITVRAIFTVIPTALLASMVTRILDAQKEELNLLVSIDPLTGVMNRRRLTEMAHDRIMTLNRYSRPSSLILLDIDHFKKINDELGHDIGDNVLRSLCAIVKKRIRVTDHFFRFGGEEFIVVLPETNLEGAQVLAEDLRRSVAEADLLADRKVTISLGLSQAKRDDQFEQWLKRCDVALYEAKGGGRNQVRVSAAG